LEIKTAVSDLQSDLKSIDATRIARELAEENVRNQKARYDVGLATTKDLLDFQDRLTLAQAAEVQALTAYNTDLAEMRRVEGTLMSARNVMIERVSPEHAPWWASF
jgi:outer membrane protein TolC